LKKAQGIERSMIYDMKQFLNDYPDANLDTDLSEWVYDIPVQERIHEKVVEFDADAIAKLQERVPMWREHLKTLDFFMPKFLFFALLLQEILKYLKFGNCIVFKKLHLHCSISEHATKCL
jgi:hypothetical protein